MTVKRKAIIFILIYALLGITGIVCSGGTFHVLRQSNTQAALETNPHAKLRMVNTAAQDKAVMVLCRDQDNTFYQYPIVKDIPYCTATDSPENITWLKLSKCSRSIYRRKNSCVLKMSMIVENQEHIPVITDNLGSEFKLSTKESANGETVLYVRRTFKGDIPANYILWIDDQEILFN